MNENGTQRATLTVEEVAGILGIGRSAAYAAVTGGQIPGTLRIGRRLLVSKAALTRWLDSADSQSKFEAPPS